MLNLITFNRWWDTGRVEETYLEPHKRPLFHQLENFLEARQILLIYGLRRVGKTTLLYQLIDHLLKEGVNKKHILYFSFDEKAASLEDLLKTYSETVLEKDLLKSGRVYIFLDEVQKLSDWQTQLKIFYDLYPQVKFIVSGSASLIISKGAQESLAGRMYEFVLPLLEFSEYLNIRGEKTPPPPDIFNPKELREVYLKRDRLSPLFISYLKKGGFIEITAEEDDFKIKTYSKSILERIIFSDIPQSFKIREPQILKAIIELVASNPGFLLDYSKLAETLGKDQRVVANYIFYLKYSLLVKLLYNFSGSRFASERKLKKIYLTSTNFIYQMSPEKFNDPEFLGKVVENWVITSFPSKFFWRQRQVETDMVLNENIPLEVKYRETAHRSDLRGVLGFCSKFNRQKGVVVTKEDLRQEKIDDVEISFIPAWLFALTTKP